MEDEEKLKEETDDGLLAHLNACHDTCMNAVMYSLHQGGDFAKVDHIRSLLDCAQFCTVATDFYIRDSETAGEILNLCAEICDESADSCELFFEDQAMKDCAEVCRNCSKICQDAVEEVEEDFEDLVDDEDQDSEEIEENK